MTGPEHVYIVQQWQIEPQLVLCKCWTVSQSFCMQVGLYCTHGENTKRLEWAFVAQEIHSCKKRSCVCEGAMSPGVYKKSHRETCGRLCVAVSGPLFLFQDYNHKVKLRTTSFLRGTAVDSQSVTDPAETELSFCYEIKNILRTVSKRNADPTAQTQADPHRAQPGTLFSNCPIRNRIQCLPRL